MLLKMYKGVSNVLSLINLANITNTDLFEVCIYSVNLNIAGRTYKWPFIVNKYFWRCSIKYCYLSFFMKLNLSPKGLTFNNTRIYNNYSSFLPHLKNIVSTQRALACSCMSWAKALSPVAGLCIFFFVFVLTAHCSYQIYQ